MILSTTASYVMKKRRVRLGYVWMMLGMSALLVWFVMMFLPYERDLSLLIQDWFQSVSAQMELMFAINPGTWAVVFALLSLHVFFLFTAATFPELERDFIFWIIEAIEVALTFAILVSANLMTVILTWTILDIFALLYHIFLREDWGTDEVFFPYVFKMAGSFLLIFTNAELIGSGQSTMLKNLPVANSTTLFFSAILHSGIFPYRPIKQDKRLIVTLVDYFTFFLLFISSIFLIAFLPAPNLRFLPKVILGFAFIAVVYYFSSKWLTSTKTLPAIQNLLFSFVGFLGFLFSVNNQSSIIHWFVVLILGLNYLLLYYRHSKALRGFSILLILSMTGLPFSLIDYSAIEFNSVQSVLLILGLVTFHVIWNIGFLRLLFKEKEVFEELQSSYQMVYMSALGLALLSIGVITYRSLGSLLDELTNWWIGLAIILATAGIYFWQTRKEPAPDGKDEQKAQDKRVIDLLKFQWLFNAADVVVQFIRRIVSTFSQILEGEGGVLWSIVLLALLFTLLKIG